MLPILLSLACVQEQPVVPETTLSLPTSGCGGRGYEWLPLDGMGDVLDWEELPDFSMDAASIRALVGLAGLDDTSSVVYDVQVYRVRYLTQDRGEEAEATGLVAFPDADGLEPPTVLYLHPTTGMEDFCAPSGRDVTWAIVPLTLAGIGYAVAAPDYLGQNG